MECRNCQKIVNKKFVDLGFAPPSNAFLTNDQLNMSESYYPLRTFVCKNCWLVQTEDFPLAQNIFNDDYVYFSSTSIGWLNHAKEYANKIISKLNLDKDSFVVEIASNDGYLLRNFIDKNIPCLGIEPTASTAKKAEEYGIDVKQIFFNKESAQKLAISSKADLIVANNVFAHVPNLLSFTKGLSILIKDEGTITIEVSHILELLNQGAFDSIYHEHFSYYSLTSLINIFQNNGLRIYDVEKIMTHCGSLRVYVCKVGSRIETNLSRIKKILDEEERAGILKETTYINFQNQVNNNKDEFLEFLINAKLDGKKVAGYGAAAKGNTLLNYAGVKTDLLPYICDLAKSKQGKFTPGGHIPIYDIDYLYKDKPDYIIIFPWNISDEIMLQNLGIKDWGGKFFSVVPEIKELL
jgi:hypothetical protein